MPHSQSYSLFCCFASISHSALSKQWHVIPFFLSVFFAKIVLCLFFPLNASSQTFKKDRFVAHQNTVVWTEHVEVKDMDTPIIAETLIKHLKSRDFVLSDSLQTPLVLTGRLLSRPASSITKARFRIDILYESYIITVSQIILENKPIETLVLKTDGTFMERFPELIDQFDETVISLFTIEF